jgi:hypothetical protein
MPVTEEFCCSGGSTCKGRRPCRSGFSRDLSRLKALLHLKNAHGRGIPLLRWINMQRTPTLVERLQPRFFAPSTSSKVSFSSNPPSREPVPSPAWPGGANKLIQAIKQRGHGRIGCALFACRPRQPALTRPTPIFTGLRATTYPPSSACMSSQETRDTLIFQQLPVPRKTIRRVFIRIFVSSHRLQLSM